MAPVCSGPLEEAEDWRKRWLFQLHRVSFLFSVQCPHHQNAWGVYWIVFLWRIFRHVFWNWLMCTEWDFSKHFFQKSHIFVRSLLEKVFQGWKTEPWHQLGILLATMYPSWAGTRRFASHFLTPETFCQQKTLSGHPRTTSYEYSRSWLDEIKRPPVNQMQNEYPTKGQTENIFRFWQKLEPFRVSKSNLVFFFFLSMEPQIQTLPF